MAQEILRATIPTSNKWHTEDIEVKAKQLGMDKSEFILKAVDMMMNFDKTTYKKIEASSDGLNIPEWMVIQNLLINTFADKAANRDVNGARIEILKEFTVVADGEEYKLLTGEPLYNRLKESYIEEYQQEKINKDFVDYVIEKGIEKGGSKEEWRKEYYQELKNNQKGGK